MQSKYVEWGDYSSVFATSKSDDHLLTPGWCGSGETEFHRQFWNAYSGLSAEKRVARNDTSIGNVS
jgi:hypothetical protein